MLRGTNQDLARPFNRRIVLETIRRFGPISRAEIARKVGLTTQTVSTIASEFEVNNFVIVSPGVPKGRGFPAPTLEINPNGGFACGVYVTPLGVEAGLINLVGDVLSRRKVESHQLSADDAFEIIAEMVKGLTEGVDTQKIIGVGLALPGPFDIDSMSFVGPTTMQSWIGIDVAERLEAAVPIPSFVEWDSAAAAQGEILYGLGEEFRNFYYLFVGVGLGGCAVSNNATVRGTWGNAGEIGHVPLVPSGLPCSCGNCGCLERYISLEAYQRRSAEIGEDAWTEEIAPIFRAAIVMIENLFDPELIVLGGLASRELRSKMLSLAEDLPTSVASRKDRRLPRVMLSTCDPDAVLRGAAALAVSKMFSPDGHAESTEKKARNLKAADLARQEEKEPIRE